jgi:hypothetical protein
LSSSLRAFFFVLIFSKDSIHGLLLRSIFFTVMFPVFHFQSTQFCRTKELRKKNERRKEAKNFMDPFLLLELALHDSFKPSYVSHTLFFVSSLLNSHSFHNMHPKRRKESSYSCLSPLICKRNQDDEQSHESGDRRIRITWFDLPFFWCQSCLMKSLYLLLWLPILRWSDVCSLWSVFQLKSEIFRSSERRVIQDESDLMFMHVMHV